jgi:hypothetical protein
LLLDDFGLVVSFTSEFFLQFFIASEHGVLSTSAVTDHKTNRECGNNEVFAKVVDQWVA